MSLAVWKFPFVLAAKYVGDRECAVVMPRNAKILSVGFQSVSLAHEALAAWALVDPKAEPVTRRFVLAATGVEISEKSLAGATFVGSAVGLMGKNVTHVWEVSTAVPEGV